jgi:predicted RNA polymerase sigma factor
MDGARVEGLLRTLAPQVLGALTRRYGHFDVAEDAVQEALLTAALQWPKDGIPDGPRAWLIRVASRRLIDRFRADRARTRREEHEASRQAVDAPAADEMLTRGAGHDGDDTLGC